MDGPVSFFQRERASVELAGGLVGVCGTGAAGGDWQDDTGDTPETQAIIIKWLQKSIIQDSFPSSFCNCQFASFTICFSSDTFVNWPVSEYPGLLSYIVLVVRYQICLCPGLSSVISVSGYSSGNLIIP